MVSLYREYFKESRRLSVSFFTYLDGEHPPLICTFDVNVPSNFVLLPKLDTELCSASILHKFTFPFGIFHRNRNVYGLAVLISSKSLLADFRLIG